MKFGAKISVSLTNKVLVHIDKLYWDAQHENHDLEAQVEAYKNVTAIIPKSSLPTRYKFRVIITAIWNVSTSSTAWINSILLVIDLLILVRVFIYLRNLVDRKVFWVKKSASPAKFRLRMPANSSQTEIFSWQRISDC